jgi:hypothetical protein
MQELRLQLARTRESHARQLAAVESQQLSEANAALCLDKKLQELQVRNYHYICVCVCVCCVTAPMLVVSCVF